MDDCINTAMGRRLRETRLRAGMTVSELAEAIGVPPEVLEAYEAGEERLPPARLMRVCDVLKIAPLALFRDDGMAKH